MTKTSFQRLFTNPSKLIDKEFFINRGKVPILSGLCFIYKILDFFALSGYLLGQGGLPRFFLKAGPLLSVKTPSS